MQKADQFSLCGLSYYQIDLGCDNHNSMPTNANY